MRGLFRFALLVLLAGLCGYWVAGWMGAGARLLGARAGVAVSALGGLVTLLVDGGALRRSIGRALGWMVGLFFVRLLLWGAGVAWARHVGASWQAFSVAFFALYAVLMGLEVGYLLHASRAGRQGAMS